MNISIITSLVCANYNRVDRLNIKYLNTLGRVKPRGRLHYFWCPKKTSTLPLGTFDTLTIIKNRWEMRNL
jgi:hypothetical protein